MTILDIIKKAICYTKCVLVSIAVQSILKSILRIFNLGFITKTLVYVILSLLAFLFLNIAYVV